MILITSWVFFKLTCDSKKNSIETVILNDKKFPNMHASVSSEMVVSYVFHFFMILLMFLFPLSLFLIAKRKKELTANFV